MDSPESSDWLFFTWFIFGPIIVPLIAMPVAYLAFRKNKTFLYRTLSLTSLIITLFSMCVIYSVVLGDASKQNQAGLVLVFLPIWNPLIFIAVFALTAGVYSAVRSWYQNFKDQYFYNRNWLTLKASIGVAIAYGFLWVIFFLEQWNPSSNN